MNRGQPSAPGLGEIAGTTGDDTNDGPALKTANAGPPMGTASTETAKEAPNTTLMDDDFASIAKAIMWGRCVNDAIRKFLQLQTLGTGAQIPTGYMVKTLRAQSTCDSNVPSDQMLSIF